MSESTADRVQRGMAVGVAKARSLNMRTGVIMQYVQPGASLFGIETAHTPPFVVFGGGQPITVGGAVGVAGGMVPEDEAVAAAVAEAISG